jgi:hypothetical protein
MKRGRNIIGVILLVGLVWPGGAEAQILRRLKEKAQEQVQREADRRAGEAAQDAAQNAASNVLNQDEAAPPTFGPNATGPLNAPLVRYHMTTSAHLPGLSRMASLVGVPTDIVQTITMDAHRQRTDNADGKGSTIVDAAGGRLIILDHEARTYRVMTFEEMMQGLQSQKTTQPPRQDVSNQVQGEAQFDLKVERTGKREEIHGTPAEQLILIMESRYTVTDAQSQQTQNGKFYVVADLWMTEQLGGYQTMQAYQQRLGQEMRQDLGAQRPGLSMPGMDARMGAAMARLSEEMAKVQGQPVRTTTWMVLVPIDQELDLEQVMAPPADGQGGQGGLAGLAQGGQGGTVTRQTTLMSGTSNLSDLTVTGLDPNVLDIPTGYTRLD